MVHQNLLSETSMITRTQSAELEKAISGILPSETAKLIDLVDQMFDDYIRGAIHHNEIRRLIGIIQNKAGKAQTMPRSCAPIAIFNPISFIPPGITLLEAYLKLNGFVPVVLGLDEQTIKKMAGQIHPTVVVSLTLFHHIDKLTKLKPCFEAAGLNVLAGGVPFMYQNQNKDKLSFCSFPDSFKQIVCKLSEDLLNENRK
ncbi:hypothetical protein [Dehalococcoides mccartyi]|uniref:hypothetical protein n=1 Tax=Dehalococcoides TaxID=61434 RepID=UPI00324271B4